MLFKLYRDEKCICESNDVRTLYWLRSIFGGAIVGIVNGIEYNKAVMKKPSYSVNLNKEKEYTNIS